MNDKILSGKYEIQCELGRGGMGVVYKAFHTALKSPVAIKVLHPQFSGEQDFLERFKGEARSMARVNHQNVIRVSDVVENEGSHYIIMEFFPGKDLGQKMVENGSFSPEEVLSVALQVAGGLSEAHSKGVIHRDIKPANIMVNEAWHVKITDFGIAVASGEIRGTSTGTIIGTPEYMSVEQAKAEKLDGRSDLYSLGMVMYRMLNGQTMYEGKNHIEILTKLVTDPAEYRLSFPSKTPLSLQELIRDLLKKKRTDRIADAASLVDRLKKIEANLPVEIQEPEDDPTVLVPGRESSGGKVEPKWTLWIAGAFLLLILVGGIVYLKENGSSPTTAPAITTTPRPAPTPTPEPTLTPESEPTPSDPLKALRLSIGEAQTLLQHSRSEAEQENASTWAEETYNDAIEFENRAVTKIEEADSLSQQRRLDEAGEALRTVLSLIKQADQSFVSAKNTAQKKRSDQVEKALRAAQAEEAQKKQLRADARQKQENKIKAQAETMRTLRISIGEAQSKVQVSRKEADEHNASRWVKETYDVAADLKSRALGKLDDAKALSQQGRLKGAEGRLQDALSLFQEADRVFIESKNTAQKRLARVLEDERENQTKQAQEDRRRAESERAKQKEIEAQTEKIKNLEISIGKAQSVVKASQEAADQVNALRWAKENYDEASQYELQSMRRFDDAKVLNQQGRLKEAEGTYQSALSLLEKADMTFVIAKKTAQKRRAETVEIETRVRDLKIIENLLTRFKTAYERIDLNTLQELSEISEPRAEFLERLSQKFTSISVSFGDPFLSGDTAQVVVSIEELTRRKGGNLVRPSSPRREKLIIHKKNGKWGKVSW